MPRGFKKLITYKEIAEAAEVSIGLIRKDASDGTRRHFFDALDPISIMEYICKRRKWTLLKLSDAYWEADDGGV